MAEDLHFANPYPPEAPAGWTPDTAEILRIGVISATAVLRESFRKGAAVGEDETPYTGWAGIVDALLRLCACARVSASQVSLLVRTSDVRIHASASRDAVCLCVMCLFGV